ncbi:MAG: LON peptidase substrate-binding domain-containing protein [Gemmatimonadota bacterium]|nr:LON peptidase substrate-binding domain-containing protein [Gemmatimonadota bacterium]
MRRLPLFPLPAVLFPGGPMPLHIFEPRYRQMMAHCVEGDRTFGLLYHDPDREGPFLVEPGRVGCTAEILNYQPLPDGRSLVVVRGGDRFEIEDGIESPHPYWECVAAPYADDGGFIPGLRERRRHSIRLFHDVLEHVVRHPKPYPEIDDEEETAFQLAQAIRVDAAWQQRLLESRSEGERLEQLDDLLRAVLEARPDEDS